MPEGSIGRRGVIAGTATGFALSGVRARGAESQAAPHHGVTSGSIPVTLRVNNKHLRLSLDPRTSLLDALREQSGSDRHEERLRSRLLRGLHGAYRRTPGRQLPDARRALPGQDDHHDRGVGQRKRTLHRVQAAFLHHDGYQCGYCTPGQIMSAARADPGRPYRDRHAEIREWMSGNICRCGAYPNIVAAVRDARRGRAE